MGMLLTDRNPVAIVLTKDETLTLLATLNAKPTYGNYPIRLLLADYYERLSNAPYRHYRHNPSQ